MTLLIDKSNIYSKFEATSFEELESSISNISPSMAEYYLDDLASYGDDNFYLNKSNVQKSFYMDRYCLYLDYSDNILLEIEKNNDDYETNSLW
jgi:hypothetical protein